MTIVEFLLARYADLEQAARNAHPGPWTTEGALHERDRVDVVAADQTRAGWGVASDHEGFGACSPQDARHIILNDPTYVLEDLAAKRRIVEERPLPHGRTWDLLRAWHDATLQLMALPFASHSDYDPAWRPS